MQFPVPYERLAVGDGVLGEFNKPLLRGVPLEPNSQHVELLRLRQVTRDRY